MQRVVLASRPNGAPTVENFRFEEVATPSPGQQEFLAQTLWLSLDPYMRASMNDAKSYTPPVAIDAAMQGGTVARVIESNHDNFTEGDLVATHFGWVTHAVSDGTGVRKLNPTLAPVSTSLGVLGMPGLTAYVGLLDHGLPTNGQTLVVGAATGAVGSLVGQLGKIYGMRVVGVAGGEVKCHYAINHLGFDACINHHSCGNPQELREQLHNACPDGVDIYFENVGGMTLSAVIPLLNKHARIPVCGMISWYNKDPESPNAFDTRNELPSLWQTVLVNRINIRGFIISDHYDRFSRFIEEVSGYIQDGRVRYRESIAEGLENAPETFIQLLDGGNFGKQLVRVHTD